MSSSAIRSVIALWAIVCALFLILSACTRTGFSRSEPSDSVRIAFFPNLTHAPAILCVESGLFEKALDLSGSGNKKLEVSLFESGPQAVEAIFSGSVDFAYVGPGPALNAYLRSRGRAVRIIAGAASGGASFVVQPEITSVAQLHGAKIATPQLGNTQDIAARHWLGENGLRTELRKGGDVSIAPRPNPQIFDAFRQKEIEGAWVPEPWASRLVVEGGGKVLVNETDLWPRGRFSTTVAVATTRFLEEDARTLEVLIAAHLVCVERLSSPDLSIRDDSRHAVNSWIARTLGKPLREDVLQRAWAEVTFTSDPLSDTIVERGIQAAEQGLLPHFDNEEIHTLFEDNPLDAATQLKDVLSRS